MFKTKKVSAKEIEYGILTTRIGTVRNMLPAVGQPVVLVDIEGKRYELAMHKTVSGRIDGLTHLYRDYNVEAGDFIGISNDKSGILIISFWHLEMKKKTRK